MVTTEIQKRNQKAQKLQVLETDDGQYFVESSDGKILYRVSIEDDQVSCMCGDFAKRSKNDSDFKCKHILAVFNALATGDITSGTFIEKVKPKLDERFIKSIKGREFCLYAGLPSSIRPRKTAWRRSVLQPWNQNPEKSLRKSVMLLLPMLPR